VEIGRVYRNKNYEQTLTLFNNLESLDEQYYVLDIDQIIGGMYLVLLKKVD